MAAFWGTRICLLGLTIGGLGAAAAQDTDKPGDFNADGIVDLADYSLLQEAQGEADPAYDLNADGTVDLRDVFVFAELFEGAPEIDGDEGELELPYQVLTTSFATVIALPHCSAIVQPAQPFGITSLRLQGQPVDFVAPGLSIGDWEWFWFRTPDASREKLQIKLLTSQWDPPSLVSKEEYVELTYRRQNTLRAGIAVAVRFRFWALEPRFDVEYSISNGSGYTLYAPYAMVGFPGFTDHRWVSGVADGQHERQPWRPHRNYFSEALSRRLPEYLLLRHDVEGGAMEGLKSRIAMAVGDGSYVLDGYFLPTPGLAKVHSAHTNKPGYLTSHLYATFEDLPHQQSRSLLISYVLGHEGGGDATAGP